MVEIAVVVVAAVVAASSSAETSLAALYLVTSWAAFVAALLVESLDTVTPCSC